MGRALTPLLSSLPVRCVTTPFGLQGNGVSDADSKIIRDLVDEGWTHVEISGIKHDPAGMRMERNRYSNTPSQGTVRRPLDVIAATLLDKNITLKYDGDAFNGLSYAAIGPGKLYGWVKMTGTGAGLINTSALLTISYSVEESRGVVNAPSHSPASPCLSIRRTPALGPPARPLQDLCGRVHYDE